MTAGRNRERRRPAGPSPQPVWSRPPRTRRWPGAWHGVRRRTRQTRTPTSRPFRRHRFLGEDVFAISNMYSTTVWAMFEWHHPDCIDGGDWRKRGWWRIEPGQTSVVYG